MNYSSTYECSEDEEGFWLHATSCHRVPFKATVRIEVPWECGGLYAPPEMLTAEITAAVEEAEDVIEYEMAERDREMSE